MWLDGPARFAADASLSQDDEGRMSFPKPSRGSALVASRLRRRERKAAEDAVMRAAKQRDGHRCRFPWCDFRGLELPLDACHVRHRGMGGNPSGDRTATTDQLICFCRRHHGLYDAGTHFDIQPQTPKGCDGPVDFTAPHGDSGRWEVFAAETIIGISVVRTT
jgi:hypothetical protein